MITNLIVGWNPSKTRRFCEGGLDYKDHYGIEVRSEVDIYKFLRLSGYVNFDIQLYDVSIGGLEPGILGSVVSITNAMTGEELGQIIIEEAE